MFVCFVVWLIVVVFFIVVVGFILSAARGCFKGCSSLGFLRRLDGGWKELVRVRSLTNDFSEGLNVHLRHLVLKSSQPYSCRKPTEPT